MTIDTLFFVRILLVFKSKKFLSENNEGYEPEMDNLAAFLFAPRCSVAN